MSPLRAERALTRHVCQTTSKRTSGAHHDLKARRAAINRGVRQLDTRTPWAISPLRAERALLDMSDNVEAQAVRIMIEGQESCNQQRSWTGTNPRP